MSTCSLSLSLSLSLFNPPRPPLPGSNPFRLVFLSLSAAVSGDPVGTTSASALVQGRPAFVMNVRMEVTACHDESNAREAPVENAASPSSASRELADDEITTVQISVGNPSIECVSGVLRLWAITSGPSPGSGMEDYKGLRVPKGRGPTVCLLAVPEYMSHTEVFKFIGAFLQSANKVRFVRQVDRPRVHSCILEFRDQTDADDFFVEYNSKRYTSFEEDVCCVIYVESLRLNDGTEKRLETANEREIPSCPVCLERLDSHISGVVTTVCNHDFHPECLQKCATSACPVCRYTQADAETPTTCCSMEGCDCAADLWICIICGNVGCGRYANGHAQQHYQETGHCYALELETQRVWDYMGDEYVHRLIRSKCDGYLVEVPTPASMQQDDAQPMPSDYAKGVHDELLTSKLEAISFEYNNLLTAQLDSQRQYFEERINALSDSCAHNESIAHSALTKAKQTDAERKAVERKFAELKAQSQALEKEVGFLKDLNESLLRDKKNWQDSVRALEGKIAQHNAEREELVAQNAELMVHIETQNMADDGPDGIKDGSLILRDGNASRDGQSCSRDATHARLLSKIQAKRR